jgi:hypothetical protein
MLKIFAGRGAGNIVRKALLLLLPNGDWRKRDIEMYIPVGSTMTASEASRQMANGLITALAGSQLPIYQRNRWVGSDIAFDRAGLLEAVHQIGSSAYAQFLSLLGHRMQDGAAQAVVQGDTELPALLDGSAGGDGGSAAPDGETGSDSHIHTSRFFIFEWWGSHGGHARRRDTILWLHLADSAHVCRTCKIKSDLMLRKRPDRANIICSRNTRFLILAAR